LQLAVKQLAVEGCRRSSGTSALRVVPTETAALARYSDDHAQETRPTTTRRAVPLPVIFTFEQ
jgi:hypothetical protein